MCTCAHAVHVRVCGTPTLAAKVRQMVQSVLALSCLQLTVSSARVGSVWRDIGRDGHHCSCDLHQDATQR